MLKKMGLGIVETFFVWKLHTNNHVMGFSNSSTHNLELDFLWKLKLQSLQLTRNVGDIDSGHNVHHLRLIDKCQNRFVSLDALRLLLEWICRNRSLTFFHIGDMIWQSCTTQAKTSVCIRSSVCWCSQCTHGTPTAQYIPQPICLVAPVVFPGQLFGYWSFVIRCAYEGLLVSSDGAKRFQSPRRGFCGIRFCQRYIPGEFWVSKTTSSMCNTQLIQNSTKLTEFWSRACQEFLLLSISAISIW